MWFDSHCHLADPRFDVDRDRVLERARAAGVDGWVQGGTWPDDWERQLKLFEKYGTRFITAFGVHPWWAARHADDEVDAALTQLQKRVLECRAIGELGLDWGEKHGGPEARIRQTRAFETQIALAKAHPKPLVLHIVRAHPEALRQLKPHAPFLSGGIVHSFSGSYETAKQYCDLGLTLSVGASLTRPGYETLKNAVSKLGWENLVVETDAPDQLPTLPGLVPGSRNEPANLVGVASVLAELRGVDYETVLSKSTENLNKMFGMVHE